MTEASRRRFRFLGIVGLVGFCWLGGLVASAEAATDSLFAAPSAAGTGDCSSPANACSIATAVANANAEPVADSVRIELASGTYLLSAPSPTALSITFAGPSLTFEAESGTPILDGTHTVRLLSVGSTSHVTVIGLGFEAGATTGLGGAITNSGTLTVQNSTFSGNSATSAGAIQNATGATLTVQSSTFSNNTTTGVGGGAILSSGTATIERSALLNNTAPVNGGAINVQPGGVVTVASSTLAGNTSGSLGGAISNLGTVTVEASTIIGNSGSAGAALATGNANVTFAADIIGAQASGSDCNPANTLVDAGYNLDDDGTCISATSPATGSHNGTTAYGSSTYAAILKAYLASGPANNGGPTETVSLLNSPNPSTTLANPAFDVVPASFNLPAAVDGVSAACSVSDQRGVVPVSGRSCDVGAYLLQATTTALTTSATQVAQTLSVTYTATITPAPDGGTVSFNDGAGNPATVHCPAQSVSGGTATCTVSYANTGSYSVTATYSGDGAMNNFAGSASTAQTVAVQPAAHLVLHKQVTKPRAYPGERLTYALTVTNDGPSAATDVSVADTPTIPIKIISIHAGQGTCAAQPTITCTLGTLGVGNTADVTIVAEVKAGGLERNTATATSATTLLSPQDATSTATTTVTPILRLRKTASVARARTGQDVTFKITVTNPTLVAIAHVTVCDQLPRGLLYVRSRPTGTVRTGRPCWTVDRLPAGRSEHFIVVANAAPGTGGKRVNRATATARGLATAHAAAGVSVIRTPQVPCAVASHVSPAGSAHRTLDPIAKAAC